MDYLTTRSSGARGNEIILYGTSLRMWRESVVKLVLQGRTSASSLMCERPKTKLFLYTSTSHGVGVERTTVPVMFILGTGWRGVVCLTPRPLCLHGNILQYLLNGGGPGVA